ncbi:MAG: hypothetical protein KF902_06020 [Phycisphaeraceae bacterium]|nr:hypothetical protein [Phycisphaeraceae bacterium]
MTSTFVELSEDAFNALFPLVPNHLNPNASWSIDEQGGCLFETFGPDEAFVREQDPRRVWTYIDGDDGGLFVISGFHVVNRIGYLVSAVALPEGVDMRVTLESDSSDAE